MATVPVNSKSLHNFSLPHLKWGEKTMCRYRTPSDPTPISPPHSDSDSQDPKCPPESRSRLPLASCSSVVSERENNVEREKACDEEGEADESAAKAWNLRPRKAVARAPDEIGDSPGTVPAVMKSQRVRGNEGQGNERREKRLRLWISLTREEIEEDVYALTGSKPSRRPKKRTRIIQKQLDNVFPGLYLVGATADSYRIYDNLR